ncbi:trypsin-like peptidase domain-containing protein [Streptomyces sp. NPDC093261]|uniref:VMAP-C domain-containing protein n=1 Tax=Streptomyces sp. NPDC093261 TaxID=3366037 RepID=UPI0038246007
MSERRDARLEHLIENATVHFHSARPDDEAMWGSGFLVAPGWVLTCAHVLLGRIGDSGEEEFRVRGPGLYDGRPVPARLEECLYQGPLGEQAHELTNLPVDQDMALVRLLDRSVEHECVWLSDRSDHPLGDHRIVYGYRPLGDGAAQAWNGEATVNAHDGPYGLRLGPSNEFPAGVSGGPVLDPATGAVVAVIKCRRGDRDGGLSIAVSVMRRFAAYHQVIAEHDRWHEGRRKTEHNWVARQTKLPGTWSEADPDQWSPVDRRRALALLAAVEPADAPHTITQLVRKARGDDPAGRPHLPVSWRDGHGQLYEGDRPQEAFVHLRYLRLVQLFLEARDPKDRVAVERLGAWIQDRLTEVRPAVRTNVEDAVLPPGLLPSGQRAVEPYPGPGERGVVLLELEPLDDDHTRFYWTLRVDDGGENSEIPRYGMTTGPGVARGRLRDVLHEPLAEAFESVDRPEQPAPLEVALNLAHFDTPVHTWQIYDSAPLWDRARQQLLGVRRPVVIRDIERRGVPAESWAARWAEMLSRGRLTARNTVFDADPLHARQFAEMAPGQIPVQCRRAGSGAGRTAMRLALDAGHGVALWHAGDHPGHQCGSRCDDLHRSTVGFLAEVADPAELPDRLRRIREHISTGNGHQWAGEVAVLYDDPRRPLPAEEGVFDAP